MKKQTRSNESKKDKPILKIKPRNYQPSKAELREKVRLDTTPERLAECLGRQVKIQETD